MDQVFDFSAAPHLPLSLREATTSAPRPEVILASLFSISQPNGKIAIHERNGELYIEFATAA